MSVDGATRDGGAAGDNYWAVQEADQLVHCQGSGAVPDIQGRGDLT